LAWADTGLHFQGNAPLNPGESVRFYFADAAVNGLPIYPVTIIWETYPEQQTGYYATFFYCAEDGTQTFGECFHHHWGAHPYPQGNPPASGTTHKWEIATDGDYQSSQSVEYDRSHTQAMVVWNGGASSKWHRFY